MKNLVASFPEQLKEAIEIGNAYKFKTDKKSFSNVIICGLGGSGIGGTIISEIIFNEIKIPVTVCKGYSLPAFVNNQTLVIASSYSGNTEETLYCVEQALNRKATIVCVTSGGKLAELAKANGIDCILIPNGKPPRACFGYSFTQLFYIFSYFNLISDNFKVPITDASLLLKKEHEPLTKTAKEISQKLYNALPVIYSTTQWEGVAIRLRQQLNENSKILCWHHVIPEMNHNELVGWTQKNEKIAVLIFRDSDEYERNNLRIEINKKVISQYTSNIIEMWSKGKSPIEKALYWIHLGDWISVFLAEKNGVDAIEVNVINHLKSELAKK